MNYLDEIADDLRRQRLTFQASEDYSAASGDWNEGYVYALSWAEMYIRHRSKITYGDMKVEGIK